MSEVKNIDIPMDVFESWDELLVVIPLGWVSKNSIEVYLEKTRIIVKWERKKPNIKDWLLALQQDCFWWVFSKTIELPQNVYFDKINTKLTIDNILLIIVPKIIIPDKIKLQVEFND